MIANGALLAWPVIALILYLSMPVGRATIWTILGAFLLLPVGTAFNIPGIPNLDKSTLPNLAALMLAPTMARSGEFKWPKSMAINLLMLLWVLVPFATAMTNGEPLISGSAVRPGLGFKEGLSSAVGNALAIVPFVLGAALLANPKSHKDILQALVLAALVYSIPILLEIRLSPFFQANVYGATSVADFLQQMRSGGFRAMVFMGHGLIVSTFLAMSLVAAIGLWRMRVKVFGLPALFVILYLAIVLVLNKSVGSMLLAAALAPLFILLKPRRFLAVTLVIAAMLVTYPALRGANVLPLNKILETVRGFSTDRAQSFEFRLKNEELLLDRAERKPLFGWGTYGRNRLVLVTDAGTVKDVAVTDGTWVLMIGTQGWVGYVACFGLLVYPMWSVFRLRKLALPMATIALVAVHLINLMDLIPNSSLRPLTWLIAGALASMSIATVQARRSSPAGVRRVAPVTRNMRPVSELAKA
jgi:hypothetical protein